LDATDIIQGLSPQFIEVAISCKNRKRG